jgi:predicted phosphate transport protein (TIGR00153 family)
MEVVGVKRSWFLPESPDVLGMLRQQAAVTVEGMQALVAWASREPEAAQRVRDCEHRADDTKRELRLALTVAFMTPIDAEDLYVMSERLDAVLNGAKDAVREAEVMAVPPDEAVAAMAALLADGVRHLAEAFERLEPDRRRKGDASATDAADAAVKTQRQLERVYRQAASALLEVEDLRAVMGRRELYRRVSRISETLTEVADRVWYATVKEG